MQKGKLSSMTAILKKKTPESADARHVYFFGMGCGALWGEGSEGSRIMGGLHRTGRPCSHQWSDCAVSDGQTKGFKTVPLPLCHRQRIRESARGEMFSFFCVFSPMCSMCFVFFFFPWPCIAFKIEEFIVPYCHFYDAVQGMLPTKHGCGHALVWYCSILLDRRCMKIPMAE